ncbi:hypothetical protein ACTXGL_06925 [Psychrobacter sp. T6-6]|uniref:hypothetical protein n=1 Tax=Psychrobacter sp. T6-6 TaxID=3457452 RepID=UPI003FD4AB77
MDTQRPVKSSTSPNPATGSELPVQNDLPRRSLVPKGITIGLATFALVLSLAGYGFRLMIGDDVGTVLRHAAVIVPAFVLGIPLFFWVGSRVLNKVKGMHIETRNALTLGWLTACVSMLWLMGTYS